MLHPGHSHVEPFDLLSKKQRCQRGSGKDLRGKIFLFHFILVVIELKDLGIITIWEALTQKKKKTNDLRNIYS